jgi:hypothetical protein
MVFSLSFFIFNKQRYWKCLVFLFGKARGIFTMGAGLFCPAPGGKKRATQPKRKK